MMKLIIYNALCEHIFDISSVGTFAQTTNKNCVLHHVAFKPFYTSFLGLPQIHLLFTL